MGGEKVKDVHDCNSAGLNVLLSSVSHSMASASCCSALMDGIRCISVSNNSVCCDVVSSKEQTSNSEMARIRTCGLRPMNARITLLDMRNERKTNNTNLPFECSFPHKNVASAARMSVDRGRAASAVACFRPRR